MATWSLKQTGLNDSSTTGKTISILETGGVKKAYIYNNNGHVLEYNAATDSLVAISDATSWGGDTMPTAIANRPGPVVFGGEVYAYVHDAGAVNDGVWKWDGTDVSGWTRVFDAAGTVYTFFSRSENHLLLAVYPDAGSTQKYSTDGSSWSDANTSDDSPAALGFSYTAASFYSGDHSLGAFLKDRSTDGGAPAGSIIVRLFKWSEANLKWEIINSGDDATGVKTGDYWVADIYTIGTYYWRKIALEYEFSSNLSSWTTPTTLPEDVDPADCSGLSAVTVSAGGYDDLVDDNSLYLLEDGVDWSTPEELVSVGANHLVKSVFMFSGDGTAFAIIRSDDGVEIWGRSAAFVVTVAATFYHGIDELISKATLAVTEPGPHGMAVNTQGEVVIGSGEAGATMSEKLTNADDYATTEDYTNGLDITEGLNVVRYI